MATRDPIRNSASGRTGSRSGPAASASRRSGQSSRIARAEEHASSPRETSRSGRREDNPAGSRVGIKPSGRASRESSGENAREISRSRRAREEASESGTSRSSRSSRSQRQNSDARTSTRSRRGGEEDRSRRGNDKNKQQQMLLIYGGGGVALLVMIALIAHMVSSSGTAPAKAKIQQVQAQPQAAAYDASTPPYSSPSEAARMLNTAQKLFNEGMALSGAARNQKYTEAAHICRRILNTPGITDSLGQETNTLFYSARKCETM